MKSPKKPRSQKVAARADKKMTKAKKSWTKAEQARKDSSSRTTKVSASSPGADNLSSYANRMYGKAAGQERKAKSLKAKSTRLSELEKFKTPKKKTRR
jgi:hypothetical protein